MVSLMKKERVDLSLEKRELLKEIGTMRTQHDEKSSDETASDAEKKALTNEINRLEKLQESMNEKLTQKQSALDAAYNEIRQLQTTLSKNKNKERNYSLSSAASETSQLRHFIVDLERKLRMTEELNQRTLAKCSHAENERNILEAALKRAEEEKAIFERDAAHFKIQISEMEEKIHIAQETSDEMRGEREEAAEQMHYLKGKLSSKQKEIDELTRQLASFRSKESAHAKANAHLKHATNDTTNDKSKNGVSNEKTFKNDCERMTSAHKRDRDELLVIRKQVAILQNDILVAQEERKKSGCERPFISREDQANGQVSSVAKQMERGGGVTGDAQNDEANTALAERLTQTLAVLEQKKDQINHLENQLAKALSHQDTYDETIQFLKQELLSLRVDEEKKEGKCSTNDDKDLRIIHLEDCIESLARDKETYAEQNHQLKAELAALKDASSQHSSVENANTTDNSSSTKVESLSTSHGGSSLPKSSRAPPAATPDIETSLFDTLDDMSSFMGLGQSLSDMSVASKTIMSMDSKNPITNVAEKHTVYARKLNQQLGSTRERENNVSATVTRKISLLLAEITKLASSESSRVCSGASKAVQYDLECRLTDVAQLPNMLDLLITDKTKNEQHMKALYGANKLYLKEVKATLDEQSESLEQQEAVIDTLCKELEVLEEREQVESCTLSSEITLLEENITHLREQYDLAIRQHEQVENRYEMALRERNSLEAASKQMRAEKEHCLRRMSKMQQTVSRFQREMELRMEALRSNTPCASATDQCLLESGIRLKQTVDEFFSFSEATNRKELQLQTIQASLSDTKEADCFVSLNDWEYQLLMEKTSVSRREESRALKAMAASENKFAC